MCERCPRHLWRGSKVEKLLVKIQFNSIQFFISIHTEQYNFLPFFVLSTSLNILQENKLCFHLIIHDIFFVNMHVLWK